MNTDTVFVTIVSSIVTGHNLQRDTDPDTGSRVTESTTVGTVEIGTVTGTGDESRVIWEVFHEEEGESAGE